MTFTEEIKKPFNISTLTKIVTSTLAVVSIITCIVFYYNGRKEKGISYQINERASLIFDSKNPTSSIKRFEKDGTLITDNVYLLTGTVWNSGGLPINKSDIRKPLLLEIGGAKRILDYKLTKQIDESISNFRLSNSKTNSIKIDWDYFDPGYGFKFQVIYIGSENPMFQILGKILDVSSINGGVN